MEDKCMYCDEEFRKGLMLISELDDTYVYLHRNQRHLGRVMVVAKKHVKEFFLLSDEERNGYFSDLALVSSAIQDEFKVDKMNYGVFGDKVSHFHVHVVPKHVTDLDWGRAFDEKIEKVLLDEEGYRALILRIRKAIDNKRSSRG